MSQQQGGSPVPGRAIAELMNEITFQKVLLSSIDDSVQNHEEAESEVKAEIKILERQLRDLKRGTTGPNPDVPASQCPPAVRTPSKDTNMTSGVSRNAAGVSIMGSASSTSSTPQSEVMDEIISPSRMNLPTRKRSHSTHLDGSLAPFEDNKSRRTTPSPFMTGPTTPADSSGYEYPAFGDGYFDLTADEMFVDLDPDFLQQQKAAEERIRREKADAELARTLQNDHHGLSPLMTSVSTGLSAYDRISGICPQPSASSHVSMSSTPQFGAPSSRKLPPSFSYPSMNPNSRCVNSRSHPMASSPNLNFGSHSSQNSVRSEPSMNRGFGLSSNQGAVESEASSSRPMPGTFQDDSSTASDSDLEVIDPSAFHDNGRHTSSGLRPSFSPEANAAGQAALRRFDQGSPTQAATNQTLQLAMYGKGGIPSWVSPTGTAMLGSYAPYGNAQGPSIGSFVSPSMSGNPSTGSLNNAGGMYAGTPDGSIRRNSGLGYTVNNLPTYATGIGTNPNQLGPSTGPYINDPLPDIIRRSTNHNFDEMAKFLGNPLNEQIAGQYDYIINDPRKTVQEIKDLLENIRPDVELPPEDREGTPDGLRYPLYEHQKLALTWLKSMEEGTNKGGILADDMGLGKTISSLALMLARPSTDRLRKTTLIVGPVALVRQWEREIRTKVNGSHRLSTHMAHGQGKKLSWDELRNYDVVLTTYGTIGVEYSRWEKHLEKLRIDRINPRDVDQGPYRKTFPFLGPKSEFYRVILDEAQCIKNKATKASLAAAMLKSTTRFCLTGTPMMNNVGELYSLIRFLKIRPYNDKDRFRADFGMLMKGDHTKGDVQRAMQKLQALLKAILLRRTKSSLIDGKPIITLPPKVEEVQHVVFNEDEQNFYTALESKTRIQFNKYMKAGTIGKNYTNILVLLLRLRQCCCHPHLIHDFEDGAPADADVSEKAMIDLAKSLSPDVIARLLAAEGFECPVCYDGVPNPRIVIPCGHDTCAECLTKIMDAAVQQNVAEGNEAGGASRCPTCRGNIDVKRVIDYTTFKKVHMPDPADDDETASENSDASDDSSEEDSEVESHEDEDDNGDLRGFIVPDDRIDDTTEDEDEAEAEPKKSKSRSKSKSQRKEKARQKAKKGKQREKPKKILSLSVLKKEASQSAEKRRQYMKYLRKNFISSAKLDKCMELLTRFQQEDQKTIIFSQFVSLLDLLQVPLEKKGWKFERYDGSMSAETRNDAIVRFTDKVDCKIMLISLKAGNAGLNLVAASRVIILDPFWNPFIEMQAVDRAYRIGQQRSVEVHRILIENTVEDRIIELQQKKKKLVDAALDEGASKSLGRLDHQQLAFLFGV